jgi:gamma-aminobutyric acid receptor subunit beta
VPAADIWNPGVLVVNQRSVQRQMNDVVEVQADGTVRYVQRFYGTYSLPLDLSRFPFDSQRLPITLVARFSPEDLKLVVDEQLFAVADQLSSPNWSISSPIAATGEYRVQPGRSIAQLQILFPAKRRSGYYVWKLIVPMSFVVFMSWAVFWLSPQNLAPRTGLSATSMLTLIAFRLALGSSLPPISYLTELDVFTIGATVLVFAALAQAVVTTALWERERKQLAQSLNALSRVLFPAAFALLLVLSFSRFKLSV